MIANLLAAAAFLLLMVGGPLAVLSLDKPDALQHFSEAIRGGMNMEQKIIAQADLSLAHHEEFVKHLRALGQRYGEGALLIAKIFHKAQVSGRKLHEEPGAPLEDRTLASVALADSIAEFSALLCASIGVPECKVFACIEALVEFENMVSEDMLGLSGISSEANAEAADALASGTLERLRVAGL